MERKRTGEEGLARLALFDSGVGGLSVAREILAHHHPEELSYLGDNAHHPYGDRTLEEVRALAEEAISLLRERGASEVVIACNTASAALAGREDSFGVRVWNLIETGLSHLGSMLDGAGGKVGLIATPATVASESYPRMARRLGLGMEFISVSSARLAPMIEAGQVAGKEVEEEIAASLAPLAGEGIRALILGCTHYPLARRAFQAVMGRLGMGGVLLYDPAFGVARTLMGVLGGEPSGDRLTRLRAILTAPSESFLPLAEACLVGVKVEIDLAPQLGANIP